MKTTWMTAAAVLALAAAMMMMEGQKGYFGSGHSASGQHAAAGA